MSIVDRQSKKQYVFIELLLNKGNKQRIPVNRKLRKQVSQIHFCIVCLLIKRRSSIQKNREQQQVGAEQAFAQIIKVRASRILDPYLGIYDCLFRYVICNQAQSIYILIKYILNWHFQALATTTIDSFACYTA